MSMKSEAEFDELQAEAVVTTVGNAFDDTVATKADIAELHAQIRELEQRMTIKMGGFAAAIVGLLTALGKLLG